MGLLGAFFEVRFQNDDFFVQLFQDLLGLFDFALDGEELVLEGLKTVGERGNRDENLREAEDSLHPDGEWAYGPGDVVDVFFLEGHGLAGDVFLNIVEGLLGDGFCVEI